MLKAKYCCMCAICVSIHVFIFKVYMIHNNTDDDVELTCGAEEETQPALSVNHSNWM